MVILKWLHIRIDRDVGLISKIFFFYLFGEINALICKSTGLELNPALRDGSISHPFPLSCGFQETKKKV